MNAFFQILSLPIIGLLTWQERIDERARIAAIERRPPSEQFANPERFTLEPRSITSVIMEFVADKLKPRRTHE